jgi:nucleoid-associated protein YgaU
MGVFFIRESRVGREIMNSLNLIDMVKEQLPADFVTMASSFLGQGRDKTQIGIDAVIPGVLGGLANLASTSAGATRLASEVDDADEGMLSTIGSMFGRSPDWSTAGLRSLLGGGPLSELSANIGRTSGLSGKAVTTLLGALTPIILGVLKRVKRSKGLDSSGLASLMSTQRDYLAAAMPEARMGDAYSNVWEARDETRAPRPAWRAVESEPERERRHSSWGWVLPLALLALLAGLIWNWANRSTVRAGRDDKNVAEETARLRERANAQRTTPMVSLETLKTKYNSAIQVAREQGVQISSMTLVDGKLVLRGTAPSASAVNVVRERIRRANPRMNDVIVDLKIDSSQATRLPSFGSESKEATPKIPVEPFSRTKPTAPSTDFSTGFGARTYIVQPGDTLGKISQQFYGNTKDYMRIFNENRSQLKDMNTLTVGQRLEIPAK